MSQSSTEEGGFSGEFARRITSSGLRSIALVTLEAARPLALVMAQFIWLAQPIISLAWRPEQVSKWAEFLEEPGSVDALIAELEAKD